MRSSNTVSKADSICTGCVQFGGRSNGKMLIIRIVRFWHPISLTTLTNQVMRATATHHTRTIALLFLAGALGLWLLVHMTSPRQHGGDKGSIEQISLIKLI